MFQPQMLEKTIKSCSKIRNILKISKVNIERSDFSKRFCTQNVSDKKLLNIEDLFLNTNVQKILKKITGMNYEKVFAVSKSPLEPPKYEFVTDERLKELQEITASKAANKLQMPPVMSIRKPIDEVLSKDPELQGYLKHKVIFTDISPNVSARFRVITVRETDGTLRKASWEERDRMNQIFYPMPGRNLEIPDLFESSNLERLLDDGSYKFVLDCACCQFEPDDPEYHRVVTTTYEHIKSTKKFDDLRSTRHFGPMAFYYSLNKIIDPLLIDMIQRQLISDACDTIKLLYLMHKEFTFSKGVDESNPISVIEDYIANNASAKDDLNQMLQSFLEQSSDIRNKLSV